MNTGAESLPVVIPAFGTVLALLCLFLAMRSDKLKRLVADTPMSKTAGVFIGLVELSGTAEAERPLISRLAERPCLQYRWQVEERWSRTVVETYTDANGHSQTRTRTESGWTTVAEGGEMIPFYLKDDTGVIRILPEGAKLEPAGFLDRECGQADPLYYSKGPAAAVMNSDHRRRFVESGIPLHAPLYVMGHVREREDIVAPEVAQNKETHVFLISTHSREQVRAELGWSAFGWGVAGFVFCAGGWTLRGYALNAQPDIVLASCGTAGFIAAAGLGWTWMAYNGLIGLRQRVRQAWSQVDVQLKRRNDLIPNLVRIITGLRDYEKSLQTEVATLRAQLTATPPGEPGPDHAGCAAAIQAVVERYPDLKAHDSFMSLQKSLVDTEQRIALARGYFNDIATFYNTRLQVVPDRYIAALGRLRAQTLMTAESFERAAVEVNLAT